MKLIEGKWEIFTKMIMPEDAGLTQIEETKKAFYAGVATMYEIAVAAPSMLNDVNEFKTMMDNIDEELNDFVKEVGGPDERTTDRPLQ